MLVLVEELCGGEEDEDEGEGDNPPPPLVVPRRLLQLFTPPSAFSAANPTFLKSDLDYFWVEVRSDLGFGCGSMLVLVEELCGREEDEDEGEGDSPPPPLVAPRRLLQLFTPPSAFSAANPTFFKSDLDYFWVEVRSDLEFGCGSMLVLVEELCGGEEDEDEGEGVGGACEGFGECGDDSDDDDNDDNGDDGNE